MLNKKIINNFAEEPNPKNMDNLIKLFETDATENDIIDLIFSITKTTRENPPFSVVDFPSTGGPGSLSTLLCPMFLSAKGNNVLKLGVPGRPAGGIDVLAQIPNYKIAFTKKEYDTLLPTTSYIHFLTSKDFLPLDNLLYNYRKKKGKINIPKLAIASILSKKFALGLSFVGLDIRFAEFNNFGENLFECRFYANSFNKIAEKIGIKSICFINDASQPLQPYIGRGESLLALHKILNESNDTWLEQHKKECEKMVDIFVRTFRLKEDNWDYKKVLEDNLKSQGSSYMLFSSHVEKISNKRRINIKARQNGIIQYDLNYIRKVLTSIQIKESEKLFADNIGVILLKEPGASVKTNDDIISLRCDDEYLEMVLSKINGMYYYNDLYKDANFEMEVIFNG